jgi:hypothetical protein
MEVIYAVGPHVSFPKVKWSQSESGHLYPTRDAWNFKLSFSYILELRNNKSIDYIFNMLLSTGRSILGFYFIFHLKF